MVNRVSSLQHSDGTHDEPQRQLNVLISEERHKILKQYAVSTSQSMSKILSQWIDEKIRR